MRVERQLVGSANKARAPIAARPQTDDVVPLFTRSASFSKPFGHKLTGRTTSRFRGHAAPDAAGLRLATAVDLGNSLGGLRRRIRLARHFSIACQLGMWEAIVLGPGLPPGPNGVQCKTLSLIQNQRDRRFTPEPWPSFQPSRVEFVLQTTDEIRQQVARRAAAPMFFLSFLFLAGLATLIVLWVDVVRFHETPHPESAGELAQPPASVELNRGAMQAGYHCLRLLGLLWPFFLLEFAVEFLLRDRTRPFWRRRYYGLIVCSIPPLRLCSRHPDMGGRIWFPGIGWQEVNNQLRRQLDHMFSIPMIFIALTILPVLLVEYGMSHQVSAHPWLRVLLHVSMGIIWLAFATEFIVMVSVARRRLRYCKEHWLDLAIILLPLISFLRSLRVIRATRLARLAKIQQLSKMGRLYRLRGLVLRAIRAILLLELLHRLFGISVEKKIKALRRQLEEKEREVDALKASIADLERRVAEQAKAELAQSKLAAKSSTTSKSRYQVQPDIATEEVT